MSRFMREQMGAADAEVLPASVESQGGTSFTHHLPIQATGHVYGSLRLKFDLAPEQSRLDLLDTCADQIGMALNRIELAERARKSQQFEEADRLKTTLLRAVSHDLRTPITVIKTSASNLRQFGVTLSSDEQSEIAETIEGEADQLDKLVGNLLDLSRLEAGALKLKLELNSLEEVAGDVAARVWQLTHEERIRIAFPDDMPLVEFDYGLMLQALSNLIDNSLRYERRDTLVEIRGQVLASRALVKVINHGESLPSEVKAHIMEPFYRGHEGHIGLGLPIAQGIIKAHHGELRIEDTPGSGVTFVIELPLGEVGNP